LPASPRRAARRRGRASTSRRDRCETSNNEIRVVRERARDPVARGERHGHPVNQARAAADPPGVRQRSVVKRPIDHLYADRWQEIVDQRSDRSDPEARTDQGHALASPGPRRPDPSRRRPRTHGGHRAGRAARTGRWYPRRRSPRSLAQDLVVALGDVTAARVERAEHRSRSKAGRPARLEFLREGGVHGLPHEGPHAHVPAPGLAPEPRMLGVGQSDRDATHARTVPYRSTLISVEVRGIGAIIRSRDHRAITREERRRAMAWRGRVRQLSVEREGARPGGPGGLFDLSAMRREPSAVGGPPADSSGQRTLYRSTGLWTLLAL
jgi:hypothetical protein